MVRAAAAVKTPRDGGMGVIALALEGLYLPTQRRLVGDAPSEALATQHAQLDLCHVQPTAMLWGVVELQALQYPPCLHRGKGLVQRCRPVGIEVVQHDPNPLRLGVGFVHQPPHLVGKVLHPPLLGDRHMPPTPQGLAEHEQIARAVASVLIVKPLSPSPMGWIGMRRSAISWVEVSSKQTVGRRGS